MNPPAQTPLVGIAFLVAAVGCFVVLDTSIKILALSISILIALWFRYLFQAVVMAATILPLHGWRFLRTQHPWLHAVRGVLLLLTSGLGFFSLKYMPIGEFTAVIMLTPLMVSLMAAVFLKERVSALRWLLVAGGFAGAMLVVQPGHTPLGWAVLLPLSAVMAYALFQILTSRMARTEHPMVLHFYTGWVGTLVMTTLLPWIWEPIPDTQTGALMVLASAMGTVGHFLLILAFARAPAATLAPYLYVQIAFAMLSGWLLFDHVPGPLELLGIALIAVCGATAAWLSTRVPKPEVGSA